MKTCPNCKTTGIPDDAQFCPKCGKPMLSPAQKERILQERRRQLKSEAEKAWEVYPNKPMPKKNPYRIWWRALLLISTIAAIAYGIYLWGIYETTQYVPDELTWLIVFVHVTIFVIIVIAVKSATFDPDADIEKAKKEFISKFLNEHRQENNIIN